LLINIMLKFNKFVPFANRVLVKRAEPLTKTKGGIIIPESQKSEVNFGEIVAAGPGLTLSNGAKRAMPVAVGQTVLLPSYAGVKVKMANE